MLRLSWLPQERLDPARLGRRRSSPHRPGDSRPRPGRTGARLRAPRAETPGPGCAADRLIAIGYRLSYDLRLTTRRLADLPTRRFMPPAITESRVSPRRRWSRRRVRASP